MTVWSTPDFSKAKLKNIELTQEKSLLLIDEDLPGEIVVAKSDLPASIAVSASLVYERVDPAAISLSLKTSKENSAYSVWTEMVVSEEDGRPDFVASQNQIDFQIMSLDYETATIAKITIAAGTTESFSLSELSLAFYPADKIKNTEGLISTAAASIVPNTIIPRADWNSGCPMNWEPDYYKVDKIVIHHTQDPRAANVTSLAKGKAYVNAICKYHSQQRGWGDIGYNYLIDPLGNIYEGRYGGEGVEGGHAWAANKGSVGISILGDYRYDTLSAAAEESLERLLADLSQRHHISLTGSGVLANGCYSFDVGNVVGHKDLPTKHKDGLCNIISSSTTENATACPGTNIYNRLTAITNAAANLNPTLPAAGVFVAEYYDNQKLSGKPKTIKTEGRGGSLSFDWGNKAPIAGIPADKFSARYRTLVKAAHTGIYTFKLGSDDGSRLYVDNELVLNDWSDHPYHVKTVDVGLAQGYHEIRVEYYEGYVDAKLTYSWKQKSVPNNSFVGTYYSNGVFSGPPVLIRQDDTINFDWKTSGPDSKTGGNYFSVVWTGTIEAAQTDYFLFNIITDDKAKLYVDDMNIPLIDAWKLQSATSYAAIKGLSKGSHTIKMQYMEQSGDAIAKLSWAPATAAIFSSPGGLQVKDSQNNVLMNAAANQNVKVSYADLNKRYYISSGDTLQQTSNYIVITPKSGSPALTTVASYSGSYKQFRGQMIVRSSDSTRKLNVINHVAIEDYLKGLGETGLNSDPEYTKALIIAARTYALYHYQRGGKHANEYYDLSNTASDQVYYGYGYEIAQGANPVLTQAVNATKGKVITHPQSSYDNKLIVATYYSQTGSAARTCGQTKGTDRCTWSVSTWPWIPENGVADPWWMKDGVCYNQDNNGRTGAGHGYGLSGRGAYCFATQEGRSYDWLIKYYYSGVSITSYPGGTDNLKLDIGIYGIPYNDISGEKYPNGTLVKSPSSGAVYMIQNGQKRAFRSAEIFLSYGYSWSQIVEIPTAELDGYSLGKQMTYNGTVLPTGTIIKSTDSPAVYYVDANYRRPFPSAEIYLSYGNKWSDIRLLSPHDMAKFADDVPMPYHFVPLADGTIVKGSSAAVYLIDNGLLRVFPSATIFLGHGYMWSDIRTVSNVHLNAYEKGAPVAGNFGPLPDGTLLKAHNSGAVYLIDQHKKRVFPSGEIFVANGYKWGAVRTVDPIHLKSYQNGSPVLFKNGKIVKADTSSAVYLISGGKRHVFPSADVFLATGHTWNQIIQTSAAAIKVHPTGAAVSYTFEARAAGTLLKGPSAAVYRINQDSKIHVFPNAEVFLSYGYKWGSIVDITGLELGYYSVGSAMQFKDGSLVKARGGAAVYLIQDGKKRVFPSASIFVAYGYSWNAIIETDASYLKGYPEGLKMAPPNQNQSTPPDDVTDDTPPLQ